VKAVLRRVLHRASVGAAAALLLSATGATPAGAAGAAGAAFQHMPSCGPAEAGSARCHAILARPAAGPSFVGASPAGYNPPDLQSAV